LESGLLFSLLKEAFLAMFIYSESGQEGNFQNAKGRGQLRKTPTKMGVILWFLTDSQTLTHKKGCNFLKY
jgi:hypothetical protein